MQKIITKEKYKRILPLFGVVVCTLWALLFWWFVIVKLFQGIVGVNIGLGGAVYFIFFTPIVIVIACIYELFVYKFFKNNNLIMLNLLMILLPCLFISIMLIVFCPTESGGSLIEILVKLDW